MRRRRNKAFPSSISRMRTEGGHARVAKAREDWLTELNDKLLKYTPSSLANMNVYGIVLTFDELGDQDLARAAMIHRMGETGHEIRIPHFSVSQKGLLDEAEKAMGGILVLQDFSEFWLPALDNLWGELPEIVTSPADRLTIVGLDSFFADHDKLADNADALRLQVLDPDGDPMWGPGSARRTAAGASATDLEVVNRHRASIGMPPLDPAAGWTAEEIAAMAESIRTTGVMANPALARLGRGGLVKSHNPLRGFVSRYPGEEWRQKRWTWRVGPTMLWQHIGLEIKHYPDFTPPERWDTATMPFFGAPYRVRHVDMPVEGIQTYSPTEAKAIATELLTRGFGIRFNEAMRIMEDFPADELINYSAEAPSRDVSVSVYRNPTLKLKRRLLK